MTGTTAHTPADTRLLLDVMLGSLARHLRMCGYDTAYALDRGVEDDDLLREMASAEDRVLVTRDAELAERTEDAILLHSQDIDGLLSELHNAGFTLSLDDPERCSRCNGQLECVPETAETPDYAPDPTAEAVWRCQDCGQHYWKGSHWDDVKSRLPGEV